MFKKVTIGDKYLTRWHLIPRNRFFNIYLHKFTGNDGKLPHCHPWPSLSLVLKGRLREYYISDYWIIEDKYKHLESMQTVRMILPGELTYRKATFTHRLELVDGPVWSLFVTFGKCRPWGFYGPSGFVHNEEHLKDKVNDE